MADLAQRIEQCNIYIYICEVHLNICIYIYEVHLKMYPAKIFKMLQK